MTTSARASAAIRPPTGTPCPHCGCDTGKSRSGKPRSVEQLRRFFSLVRQSHFHWPDDHPEQFTDPEQFRAWLIMKAGWRDIAVRIPLPKGNAESFRIVCEMALKGTGRNSAAVIHNGELCIWVPRSIAFAKMGPAEFNSLNEAVAAVIRQETGLDPKQLLKEAERTA